MCHIPSLPIIFLSFYRQSRLLSTTKCLSWQCNLSDGEKRYDVSCRNIKCFNLQFHVHHYYHQFSNGLYNMCWRFLIFFDTEHEKSFESFKPKWRVEKESSTIFLLITCLWIINWRILMFLFSLGSSPNTLNACYEKSTSIEEPAKLSVNK